MKRIWWLKLGVGLLLLIGLGLAVPLRGDGTDAPAAATAQQPARPKMVWNDVRTNISAFHVHRTKVPGGWFVHVRDEGAGSLTDSIGGTFFYPDPKHEWDGSSQPR